MYRLLIPAALGAAALVAGHRVDAQQAGPSASIALVGDYRASSLDTPLTFRVQVATGSSDLPGLVVAFDGPVAEVSPTPVGTLAVLSARWYAPGEVGPGLPAVFGATTAGLQANATRSLSFSTRAPSTAGPARYCVRLILTSSIANPPSCVDIPAAGLDLSLIAPRTVLPGGPVTLTLVAANRQSADLRNVVASLGHDSEPFSFVPQSFASPPGWAPGTYFPRFRGISGVTSLLFGFAAQAFPGGDLAVFSTTVSAPLSPGATPTYCASVAFDFNTTGGYSGLRCQTVTVVGSGAPPLDLSNLVITTGTFDTPRPASQFPFRATDISFDPGRRQYVAVGQFSFQGGISPVEQTYVFDEAGRVLGSGSGWGTAQGGSQIAFSPDMATASGPGGFAGLFPSSLRNLQAPAASTPVPECGGSYRQIAYSTLVQQFLVVCEGLPGLTAQRFGLNLAPVSPAVQLDSADAHLTDLVWNPVSREYAVITRSKSSGDIVLLRVSSLAELLSRTIIATCRTACEPKGAVHTRLGHYVVTWADDAVLGAEVNTSGRLVTRGAIAPQAQVSGIAYNATSGTFLLGHGNDVSGGLVELNTYGAPLSLLVPTSPGVVALESARDSARWLAIGRETTFDVATLSRQGGSSRRLGGCIADDPFSALGGGTCFDGGWLPPGIPAPGAPPPMQVFSTSTPAPPPAAPPGNGCATPDPFVVLGGGTCAHGGWYPPGITPAAPVSCTTPDPFVFFGGGVCVNGGWRPRG